MALTAGVAAPVRYGRAFFALQVELARAVAALTGRPLGQALLDYTNLYVRFGRGRAFDPAHPGWQEYVAGLDRGADLDAWTYAFYLARPEAPEPPAVIERAGCFACARTGDNLLRLHFANAETDGGSPLALDRRPRRLAELGALFARVRQSVPGNARVVGASWLYNVEGYRRRSRRLLSVARAHGRGATVGALRVLRRLTTAPVAYHGGRTPAGGRIREDPR